MVGIREKSNLVNKIENALNGINDRIECLMLMLCALYRYFLLVSGNRANKAFLIDFLFYNLLHSSNLYLFVIKMTLSSTIISYTVFHSKDLI